MVKWIALVLALVALTYSADENKVAEKFHYQGLRIERLEQRNCTPMQVLTPSGAETICAIK